MKKILSVVAVICMTIPAFAQVATFVHREDGSSSETKWSINLLGLSAVNADNETHVDFNFHRDYSDSCTPGFYFGLSNMSTDDFKLKPGGSLEFGCTPIDFAWWNDHHNVGIIAGVGISWTRYAFKNNKCIAWAVKGQSTYPSPNAGAISDLLISNVNENTPGASVALLDLPEEYSNPRMTYASWRLPIEIAVNSKNCLFTAGVEGELRHHLRMRTKLGKNKKHYVTSHEMGVNPWGVNAVASIGCNGVSLFGRMALTEFFNSDETYLTGTPFMVGIRFYEF